MGLPALVIIAMSDTEIQFDIENGEWFRVREREDADLTAEVVVNYGSEVHNVQVFDTPAGWFYVSENQDELYFDLSDDKPLAGDIVEDSIAHIRACDNGYEVNGDDKLADDVAERIQDRLEG